MIPGEMADVFKFRTVAGILHFVDGDLVRTMIDDGGDDDEVC